MRENLTRTPLLKQQRRALGIVIYIPCGLSTTWA